MMFAQDRYRLIQILEDVAKDAEKDAKEFDGKPFTGKTVGEYLGYHGASIVALSNVLKAILENEQEKSLTFRD